MPGRAHVHRAVATALLALAALGLAAATAPAQRASPRPRGVESVLHAQRAFESFRRARAPERLGGTGPCEVRIGNLCYWDNNGESRPSEPREVREKRRALLDDLAATAARAPESDWVHGQLVRYLVEDGLLDEAATAARACRGTPWWCRALVGLALHERGDHAGADAAYDDALALLPDDERCAWTDASAWMDSGVDRYRDLGCGAARDSATAHFLWLSRPLWMLPGDDLRAELLSRRMMSRIIDGTAHGHRDAWNGAHQEMTLRYGWPVAWARRRTGLDASTIGYEPAPSWDVTPASRALRAPLESEEEDWYAARALLPRMRYAPRYVRREGAFKAVEHQLVFFKRGDSALAALAWDLGPDPSWARGDARVGLVLATGPTHESASVVREDAPRRGVLLRRVPAAAAVASVEAWSPRRSFAARSRYAVRPPAPDARLSSLAVLHRPPPDSALSVEEVMVAALGTRVVRAGETVHLYWETYGEPTVGEPDQVALSMQRVGVGALERAAQRIRLAPRDRPVLLRWRDAGQPRGGFGRSLALRVPDLPPGDYRVEVTVGAGPPAASTAATVRLAPR